MPHRLPNQVVLRVPEELEDTLRSKMAANDMADVQLSARSADEPPLPVEEQILELTLGDGTYPARLVNLPCVVEVHKTIDNSTLFKCGDIGQMVVVYNNDNELLEAVAKERESLQKDNRSVPDKTKDKLRISLRLEYYPNGLTPPTTGIVKRRFMETRQHGPYPPDLVAKVQVDLQKHLQVTEKSSATQTEILEDVVDFEPYMADAMGQPVTYSEESNVWREHPELMIHRPVEYIPEPEPPPPPPPPPPAPVIKAPPPQPPQIQPAAASPSAQRGQQEKPASSSRRDRASRVNRPAPVPKPKPRPDGPPLEPHYVGGVRQPPWMDRARPFSKPPPPPPGPPPPPPPVSTHSDGSGGGGGENVSEIVFTLDGDGDDNFLAWLDDMKDGQEGGGIDIDEDLP